MRYIRARRGIIKTGARIGARISRRSPLLCRANVVMDLCAWRAAIVARAWLYANRNHLLLVS